MMNSAKGGWSYITASGFRSTVYIGVTSNLIQRGYQHKTGFYEGFAKKYACTDLVWFQWHETIEAAIKDEKRLKKLNRKQKLELIEQQNPQWEDLYPSLKL